MGVDERRLWVDKCCLRVDGRRRIPDDVLHVHECGYNSDTGTCVGAGARCAGLAAQEPDVPG
jgi:hypothetical protein